ncbi:MAG: formylglycine-generating enzyme family protein [Thermoguttaceae bacterium]|nr:formylglycine-generating enzyme family protein [Thermoguttaceae bacterium]
MDVKLKEGVNAGDRQVATVNGVEFAFRWCPPGTFIMGSPESENDRNDDETQHQVTLTKGFWIMETEVTQKQWKAVMEYNPSYYKEDDDSPVNSVSWNDCQEFCQTCTQLGLPVQLPTEAQWEYACRAGSVTAYFWGDDLSKEGRANCWSPWFPPTTPQEEALDWTIDWSTRVTKYPPNPWGIYDMHGNVSEWCQDWYGKYSDEHVTDPTGPSHGLGRIFRGGSWKNFAADCRSACRQGDIPEYQNEDIGFRCVGIID